MFYVNSYAVGWNFAVIFTDKNFHSKQHKNPFLALMRVFLSLEGGEFLFLVSMEQKSFPNIDKKT